MAEVAPEKKVQALSIIPPCPRIVWNFFIPKNGRSFLLWDANSIINNQLSFISTNTMISFYQWWNEQAMKRILLWDQVYEKRFNSDEEELIHVISIALPLIN